MTKKQIVLHELRRSGEYLTVAELTDRVALHWGYSTLRARLAELVKSGLVKRMDNPGEPSLYVDTEVWENDQWAALHRDCTREAAGVAAGLKVTQPRLSLWDWLEIFWFWVRTRFGSA